MKAQYKHIAKTAILCAHILFAASGDVVAEASQCLALRAFVNHTSLHGFSSFGDILSQKLKYDYLPEGIEPIDAAERAPDSAQCIYFVAGAIDSGYQGYFLHLELGDTLGANAETRIIPLEDKDPETLADIAIAKIRDFLEQSLLSKITVSSTPLDCRVYINGVNSGVTPAELLLSPGKYVISVRADYCAPFRDTLLLTPGRKVTVRAAMRFEGHSLRPWIIGAVATTAIAVAGGAAEYHYHGKYLEIPRTREKDGKTVQTPQQEFNEAFSRYESARVVRISIMNTAALGWLIAGFHHVRNRMLKKKVFEGK
jgi:hypothetical protein